MDAIQSGRAVITRQRIGAVTHLRIAGAIDESFSPQIVAAEMFGQVVIDLGRLERISSFGVRKWIELVEKLPAGAMALHIIHAPPIIVDQLNLVEGFAGIAKVLSLLAPYSCAHCSEDRVRLVDVVTEQPAIQAGQAPAHPCPVCAQPLEFSDMPSEFFDFVRTQQLGAVDPVVTRFLNSLHVATPADTNSVSKFIEGDISFFRISGAIMAGINFRRLSAGLEGRVIYDFAGVQEVEPAVYEKLNAMLRTVTGSAQVYLSRVPVPVLTALGASKAPLAVNLCTLYLPVECGHCGGRSLEKVPAQVYLGQLEGNEQIERKCQICGGDARMVALRNLVPTIQALALTDAPSEADQLEYRALSQYLSSPGPDVTPTHGASGDLGSSHSTFQILKLLGRGGMAEVFLARQQGVKGFEKYVVVKKILGQFAQSQDFVEMLFAEARNNARLNHPNIVQTFDVGMMDGVAYITMEYIRGPDVKKAMMALRRKRIGLPVTHALRIVADTAAGLHFAHSYVDPTGKPHPMVHRDVSPHNILLSLDGAIKLSDFGIAKVQGEADQTQAGVLKGKIAYVSPEAISGVPLDARNDVFALGTVLFELLTGRLPFKRDNDAATLRAIVREPAPNPTELVPEIPQEVSNVVLWALEKDVSKRVQSAAQLRETLEAVMGRLGMSSSPAAVADYFKLHLGQELSEYGPVQTGLDTSSPGRSLSGSPNTPRPSAPPPAPMPPALAPVRAQPPPVYTPPAPAAPAPVAAEEPALLLVEEVSGAIDMATMSVQIEPMAVANRAPASAPAVPWRDPGANPPVAAPAPRPAPPAPSPVAEPPRAHPAPRPRVEPAPLPPPAAVRPPPAPRPAPAQPQPQPARAVSPPPAQPPPVQPPAPAPARPAPPAAPVEAVTEPVVRARRSRGKLWAGVVLGALVAMAAAGGVVVTRSMGGGGLGRAKVLNLDPDERLYVGGVQVDATNVRMDSESMIVSVGRDGRLLRFGTASRGHAIDARALVAVQAGSGRAQTARLKIESQPAGCGVRLGEVAFGELTPVTTTIESGTEIRVVITCPGEAPWSRYVMAVSGQNIDLKVDFAEL